jgi:hypothetical protein
VLRALTIDGHARALRQGTVQAGISSEGETDVMLCVREQNMRLTVGDNDSLAGLERHSNPGLFSTAPYLGPHHVTKYTTTAFSC